MAAQLAHLLLWMDPICVTLWGKEHPTEVSCPICFLLPPHIARELYFTVNLQREIHLCKGSHPHRSQSATLLLKKETLPSHIQFISPQGRHLKYRCLKIGKMNPLLKAQFLSRQRKNSSAGSSMQVPTDYIVFWNYIHEICRTHQSSVLKIFCVKGKCVTPIFMQYFGKLLISSYINSI